MHLLILLSALLVAIPVFSMEKKHSLGNSIEDAEKPVKHLCLEKDFESEDSEEDYLLTPDQILSIFRGDDESDIVHNKEPATTVVDPINQALLTDPLLFSNITLSQVSFQSNNSIFEKQRSSEINNIDGKTLLIVATENILINRALNLIERGATLDAVDSAGRTALMYAAHNGCLLIVLALIKNGANLDVQTLYGTTALMEAVKSRPLTKKHATIIENLINKGANTQLRNSAGKTALNIILEKPQHNEIERQAILFLLEKEPTNSLDAAFLINMRPLLLCEAVQDHHTKLVEVLLDHGALPNAPMANGTTPLMLATKRLSGVFNKKNWSQHTYAQCQTNIRLLLSHGARCDVKNNSKKKAVHYFNSCALHTFSPACLKCAFRDLLHPQRDQIYATIMACLNEGLSLDRGEDQKKIASAISCTTGKKLFKLEAQKHEVFLRLKNFSKPLSAILKEPFENLLYNETSEKIQEVITLDLC